jgi:hypothetical protein
MDDTQGELLSPNARLQEQLANKTIELQRTQRELYIEAALENVRLAAMHMKKPEELAAIATLIFEELRLLGFAHLRNTEIIINNDARQTIVSYYSDYGVTGNIEIDYTSNETVNKWAEQLRTASDAFAEVAIAENEMEAWRKYRESLGYSPDAKLNDATNVYYYSYSIGLGALSISVIQTCFPGSNKHIKAFPECF